ncbi:unnamed protein product [Rotaria magnacalcarata]|uniref:Uncharacterized protein n=1 Tax=Rotaria magnacalcarata TaxID=392030 RepID=A0A818YZQ3_9BILA|nr:unnamed protein product [Rotaria magnacalcarata]
MTSDHKLLLIALFRFPNQLAPQQDIGSTKIQYLLTKTKDSILHIIDYEDLIFHRNKSKIKVGDEVSWNGKTRNDRGRGKIIVLGTKDQCEATKTVIEESSPSSESPSTLPSSSTSLPVPVAAIARKCATKRLAIDDDDSCDSSSTKRKVVHVDGVKSKNIPRSDASTAAPIISSSTISFVTTTSSIPKVANTARILKDVDCSLDSNSEKELVINEQIFDDCDDDDVQTDNNNSTIAKETKAQNTHSSKTSKSFRALPVKKPISETAYSLLKQQCQKYSDQIDCYRATWMPRPKDPKTIKFFVEMGRLLSGEADDTSNDKCNEKGIGDTLVDYYMARLLNPLERGKTDGELFKACRNVFEAANCCKRRLEQYDNQNEENDVDDTGI